MEQKDKELLLKDLGARLAYGVKCYVYAEGKEHCGITEKLGIGEIATIVEGHSFLRVKPYLRPLSSMTEEERKEYLHECDKDDKDALTTPRYHGIDWLNANHFDYRGLISKPKFLAIEAPEGMYNE